MCEKKEPFSNVVMYEAQLTQKSLSNQAVFLLVSVKPIAKSFVPWPKIPNCGDSYKNDWISLAKICI